MCLGVPARVVEVSDLPELAHVDRHGQRIPVNLGLLEPGSVAVGDWVLVHAGMAVSRLEEDEAISLLALLEDLATSAEEPVVARWGE